MCGVAEKTVAHTYCARISKTSDEGVQTGKKNVAKMMHWKLCEKWGFSKAEKCYTQTRYCGFSLYKVTRTLNITDQI